MSLRQPHLSMIALGGVIGAGLVVGTGAGITVAGGGDPRPQPPPSPGQGPHRSALKGTFGAPWVP